MIIRFKFHLSSGAPPSNPVNVILKCARGHATQMELEPQITIGQHQLIQLPIGHAHNQQFLLFRQALNYHCYFIASLFPFQKMTWFGNGTEYFEKRDDKETKNV